MSHSARSPARWKKGRYCLALAAEPGVLTSLTRLAAGSLELCRPRLELLASSSHDTSLCGAAAAAVAAVAAAPVVAVSWGWRVGGLIRMGCVKGGGADARGVVVAGGAEGGVVEGGEKWQVLWKMAG